MKRLKYAILLLLAILTTKSQGDIIIAGQPAASSCQDNQSKRLPRYRSIWRVGLSGCAKTNSIE